MLNDVFYLVNDTEICNYADDTTLYTVDKKLRTVLSKFEKDTLLVSEWFSHNFIKLNKEKCHFLIFRANNNEVTIGIGASEISESEKLFRIAIDFKLNFSHHVNQLCAKASQKLYALARVSNTWMRTKSN